MSRTQGLLVAARYFEDRSSAGYAGVSKKHLQRLNSAFLGQLLASFEWCLKDYIAGTLDATDAFDGLLSNQDWLRPRVETIFAQRSEGGSIGALLIHPSQGWHDVDTANRRFKRLFNHELVVSSSDAESLRSLWLLRHSLAHNAGIVTHPDAYRMNAPALAGQTAAIDRDFLADAADVLRRTVRRLEDPIGGAMVKHWFVNRATGTYTEDRDTYRTLRLIGTAVRRSSEGLPSVTKSRYTKDRKTAGVNVP